MLGGGCGEAGDKESLRWVMTYVSTVMATLRVCLNVCAMARCDSKYYGEDVYIPVENFGVYVC